MQVEVNVKCMRTKFGGRGLFVFKDFLLVIFPLKFPFGPGTMVHGVKNRFGSRDSCK